MAGTLSLHRQGLLFFGAGIAHVSVMEPMGVFATLFIK
jgi:hypothetical protein